MPRSQFYEYIWMGTMKEEKRNKYSIFVLKFKSNELIHCDGDGIRDIGDIESSSSSSSFFVFSGVVDNQQ